MRSRESIKSLRPYFKKHKRELYLGALSMFLTDVCVLINPKLQAYAIRAIEQRQSLQVIFFYAFNVFFIIALAGVFRYFWRIFFINTSMKIGYELRKDLFRKLLSMSPDFYSRYTTGDLMARSTNDLRAVRMAMGPGIIFGLDILVMGLTAIIVLLFMNWKLAILVLAPTPFIALTVTYFDRKIHRVFERVQAQFSVLSEKVRENISGIRVIKAFNQEEAESENFKYLSKKYVKENMKLFNIEGIFRPIVIFFSTLSIILIMVVGLQQVIKGKMDLGDFWAFNEYLWLVVWPMIGIGWIVGMLQRGTASMKRIDEILNSTPMIRNPIAPFKLTEIKGKIEFRNVSFRYSENSDWILRNVSFTVQPGKKLAFSGRVGSGKSSLLNLLLRFYDPQEGSILLDDIDIKQLSLQELRAAYGIVPQETFLFSDTIKNNIVFGIEEYEQSDISRVTQWAQLDENIKEFPERLETLIGERGVTLSGGQKQRVALARALIIDPEILVFDDSFSSLDTETEGIILDNLKKLWFKKSVLVISHRISTIVNFDHIIVLDQGKIIEEGNHQELLNVKGLYWRMAERQKLAEKLK